MDEASKSLTNEWVSKKVKFTRNQFKVVNHLIKMAESKVRRGVDETTTRNLAVDVIHDVAAGKTEIPEPEVTKHNHQQYRSTDEVDSKTA